MGPLSSTFYVPNVAARLYQARDSRQVQRLPWRQELRRWVRLSPLLVMNCALVRVSDSGLRHRINIDDNIFQAH